jgi:general secretion pathway protein K
VGLQEARLSSFLAVEPGGEAPAAFDAFLSGVIQDQQARLNATNLVHQGQVSDTDLRAFARLYEQLGLPLPELQALASSLLRAQQAAQGQTSATAAGVPIALLPTRITQLTWLGLSGRSLQRLAPYITVLPERTPVNLNTAAPEVLVAVVPGLDMARARRLAEARALQPFKTLADASSLLGGDLTLKEAQHATTSRYFEVMGRLRLGERVVQERSLVQRNGLDVKALWRERTASRIELPPGAPAVGQTPSLQ